MKISSKEFQEYCLNLSKLANEYLKSLPNNGITFFFFKADGYEAAKSIILLTDKILFNAPFKSLSFEEEINFVEGCNTIFQMLRKDSFNLSDNRSNKEFVSFYKKFCHITKELVFTIIGSGLKKPKEVNLNYTSYYIDTVIIGLDCPAHYHILRQESLLFLTEAIKNHSNKTSNKLLTSFLEMIKFDHLIINRFSKNSKEKLLNLLKYLDVIRLALIEQKENNLVSQVSSLLHRALEMKQYHPGMKNFEKSLEKKLYQIKTPAPSTQICRQSARL